MTLCAQSRQPQLFFFFFCGMAVAPPAGGMAVPACVNSRFQRPGNLKRGFAVPAKLLGVSCVPRATSAYSAGKTQPHWTVVNVQKTLFSDPAKRCTEKHEKHLVNLWAKEPRIDMLYRPSRRGRVFLELYVQASTEMGVVCRAANRNLRMHRSGIFVLFFEMGVICRAPAEM